MFSMAFFILISMNYLFFIYLYTSFSVYFYFQSNFYVFYDFLHAKFNYLFAFWRSIFSCIFLFSIIFFSLLNSVIFVPSCILRFVFHASQAFFIFVPWNRSPWGHCRLMPFFFLFFSRMNDFFFIICLAYLIVDCLLISWNNYFFVFTPQSLRTKFGLLMFCSFLFLLVAISICHWCFFISK